ncbi:MAG: hypothetical protein M1834_005464 [Cirrosporium novae-zelandiae]|nr:MAG: hypothetical protein M1834_005464 [Cirrosporium novae-zelandiae]
MANHGSHLPSNPTPSNIMAQIPKLQDPDPDLRYMALDDLTHMLENGHPGFLQNDLVTAGRAVDGILAVLGDQNGEVQNLAIKCLGPLATKVSYTDVLPVLLNKISKVGGKDTIDSSIPSTALRNIVTTLPRPVPGTAPSQMTKDSYMALSRVLIPILVGYVVMPNPKRMDAKPTVSLLKIQKNHAIDPESVDLLIEVVRCFGPMLQESELRAMQKTCTELIESNQVSFVVKKKAVTAISVLAVFFSSEHLSLFTSDIIENLRDSHLVPAKRRLLISIIGSIARTIPLKFGPHLQVMAPFVLSPLSQEKLDESFDEAAESGSMNQQIEEVREASLLTLESLLAFCPEDMRPFTKQCIAAGLRFLTYDPNVVDDMSDDDMDDDDNEDGFADDEDFEEEELSDDDEMSWKIRRCAVKVLHTIISTRAGVDLMENGILYLRVAPELVKRFREKEENVRLEILSATSLLIQKTGQQSLPTTSQPGDDSYTQNSTQYSRKRRREPSDASMLDAHDGSASSPELAPSSPPHTGPRADLDKLKSTIVPAAAKLIKESSLPTKQAAMTMLRELIAVQRGGLMEHLSEVINPVIDTLNASNSSAVGSTKMGVASSATGGTLRVEALDLLSTLGATHSTKPMQAFVGKIVPAITAAVTDSYFKVSIAGLRAAEQFIKILTPPSCTDADSGNEKQLVGLYDVIFDCISSVETDAEVRQQAIHALGVLLARTSGIQGTKFLPSEKRSSALDLIRDRLKNETTRISAVRAIKLIASAATDPGDFSAGWVGEVALELGAQLRKADRALRGSSLMALKCLCLNPAVSKVLDSQIVKDLTDLLAPLLTVNDLQLLGPALRILASLAPVSPENVMTDDMIKVLCHILRSSQQALLGSALDAYLVLVQVIGEQSAGSKLMHSLLQEVGVNGDPGTVGKAIGTLAISGGPSVGVTVDDFVTELHTAQDSQRKCLALSVLGEIGSRLGSSSPLSPDLFVKYFTSKFDQVRLAAAIALGNAGAGNVKGYLPVVLSSMNDTENLQYICLYSIKEIVQHSRSNPQDVVPFSNEIWDKVMAASSAEEHKAVGAECLGRLAILDSKTCLPLLQQHLTDSSPSTRGMVIQALRFTLAESSKSFDETLRPIFIGMLTTMLIDQDLANRRLALSTLNSAMHNKSELIIPHLSQLLPLVIDESKKRPELIREVQMGPFKHKVDDGLDVRKSAYETLYSFLDTVFTRMNISSTFERILDGIEDESDIRTFSHLMLTKLVDLEPEETQRHLDPLADRFRTVLSRKLKENAVKQEVEKAQEAQRSVLKMSNKLHLAFPVASSSSVTMNTHQNWRTYLEWIQKEYKDDLKAVSEDRI